MEVKDAIKWIEWAEDVYHVCTITQATEMRFMEQGKQDGTAGEGDGGTDKGNR